MLYEVITVDLLMKLISFESITPDDAGSMAFIENYLNGYEAIYVNKEGVKNLFLSRKFGEGPHLCFAGHVDIVPPGQGWETNPFVPVIKEGKIYGRGTQDMKSGVAAFVHRITSYNVCYTKLLRPGTGAIMKCPS